MKINLLFTRKDGKGEWRVSGAQRSPNPLPGANVETELERRRLGTLSQKGCVGRGVERTAKGDVWFGPPEDSSPRTSTRELFPMDPRDDIIRVKGTFDNCIQGEAILGPPGGLSRFSV